MFQEGLYGFLSTSSPIQTLLGTSRGDGQTGVFPGLAISEPTLPYLVFMRTNNEPVYSMAGANKLQRSVVRIAAFGSSYKQAVQLQEAIKVLLGTFSGTWADNTLVYSCAQLNEMDTVEEVTHGSIFGCHCDYEFWYIDNNGA